MASSRSHARVGLAGLLALALAIPAVVGAAPTAGGASAPVQDVRFDGVRYPATGCATVTARLASPGDPSPDADLKVASSSGDHETIPLTAAGPDAWTASVCKSPGPVQVDDGTLQVAPGDHLLAATTTGGTASGIDVARVEGGVGDGSVDVTLNPQPFPPAPGLPRGMRRVPNPDYAQGIGPKSLHNAGLVQPDGSTVYFGQDQVIFRESAPGDLAAFLARHPKSAVLSSQTLTDVAGTPDTPPITTTYDDIYVNAANYPTADVAAQLEEAGATGSFVFTHQRALELYALILDEQAGGTQVTPNVITLHASTPTTDEAINSANPVDLFGGSSGNAWYDGTTAAAMKIGTPQALAVLDVMKQDAQPHTKVAVLDSGFAGPNDYGNNFTPPDYGAPNGDYNQIPQCSADTVGNLSCGPGVAQGKSALQCTGGSSCPWHGAQMASDLAGRLDNGGPSSDGGGTAGIGGQTADLMLYKVDWTYFLPLIAAVNDATLKGARVISMSSGFPCMQFINLCDNTARTLTKIAVVAACVFGGVFLGIACGVAIALLDRFADVDGLEKAVKNAIASDVVVVAAGGNDGKDLAGDRTVPCDFAGVVCVGNLTTDGNDVLAATSSNFGSRIDVWAPGAGLANFPTPKPVQTAAGGTSSATAFTSGVVSIVRSVAPNLSGPAVRQLLADSLCRTGQQNRVDGTSCTPSGDGKVDSKGYIDVFDVLKRARLAASLPSLGACTGGWDQQGVAPTDDPRNPRPIPGSPFPFTQFGQLGTWTGDATVKRPELTPTGQPDGQWFSTSFDPTTLQNAPKSVNVRIQLHVPDPSLGALKLEVFAVVAPGYGQVPPTLKLANPYNLVDTTSGGGTGEWDGYLVSAKTYLIHVIALAPEALNNNCFDTLSIAAVRGGGSPPPREAGIEIGSANVISGRKVAATPGATNLAIVPVTLTQPLPYPVDVTYDTYDFQPGPITALAGIDYTATSGTLTIPSGQVYAPINVPILAHPGGKAGKAFGVEVTASTAPIYVGNTLVGIEDPAPVSSTPVVEVDGTATYEGDVGAPRANAIVQLDRPASANTVVSYTLTSTDAQLLVDWNGAGGNLVIPKGQTYGVVHFSLLGDTEPENIERVIVTLTGASGSNAILGARKVTQIWIDDDDDF